MPNRLRLLHAFAPSLAPLQRFLLLGVAETVPTTGTVASAGAAGTVASAGAAGTVANAGATETVVSAGAAGVGLENLTLGPGVSVPEGYKASAASLSAACETESGAAALSAGQ